MNEQYDQATERMYVIQILLPILGIINRVPLRPWRSCNDFLDSLSRRVVVSATIVQPLLFPSPTDLF